MESAISFDARSFTGPLKIFLLLNPVPAPHWMR